MYTCSSHSYALWNVWCKKPTLSPFICFQWRDGAFKTDVQAWSIVTIFFFSHSDKIWWPFRYQNGWLIKGSRFWNVLLNEQTQHSYVKDQQWTAASIMNSWSKLCFTDRFNQKKRWQGLMGFDCAHVVQDTLNSKGDRHSPMTLMFSTAERLLGVL